MDTVSVLLIDDVDRVFLDEATKRFNVEPQRSPHLDEGKLPEPGLLVDRVHLQTQVSGSLLDIQEPLTDATIKHHCGWDWQATYLSPKDFRLRLRSISSRAPFWTGVIALSCDRWQLLSGMQGDVHIL